MEQARCWMEKQAQKFVDESWEERAFAEDAAGMLGGCVWPPRSYTCSFCGRDFRSAQALGGHMNVHRRDRAKLKQLACGQNNQVLNPRGIDCYNNNNLFHSCSSLTFSYSTSHENQDCCSFICNSPNPDSNQPVLSQELNGSKQSLNHYFSPLVINHKRKPSLEPYNLENNSKNNDLEDCNNGNYPKKSKFSLSLDLEKKCPTQVACYDEDDLNNRKRRKVDVPSQPGVSKPSGEDKVHNSLSRVDTFNSNSIEELDLELRLGVLPKVQ